MQTGFPKRLRHCMNNEKFTCFCRKPLQREWCHSDNKKSQVPRNSCLHAEQEIAHEKSLFRAPNTSITARASATGWFITFSVLIPFVVEPFSYMSETLLSPYSNEILCLYFIHSAHGLRLRISEGVLLVLENFVILVRERFSTNRMHLLPITVRKYQKSRGRGCTAQEHKKRMRNLCMKLS